MNVVNVVNDGGGAAAAVARSSGDGGDAVHLPDESNVGNCKDDIAEHSLDQYCR